MEVYEVIFSSSELQNVEEYCSEPSSPASFFRNKEEAFMLVKNKEGKTNKQAIYERFVINQKQKQLDKLDVKKWPIEFGTKLAIPIDKIHKHSLLTEGIEVVDNDVRSFKAKALADLEANEGYNPARKIRPVNGILDNGILVDSYPEATVWIWCRALSKDNKHNEGELLNVTPFIEKMSTNVGKNGGNFQISLPPLTCQYDYVREKWIIKKTSIQRYRDGADNLTQSNEGYVASSDLLRKRANGDFGRSIFFFHSILSANDLVFIRFETLEMEKDQRIDDRTNFTIDKSEIPGKIYDMIGLIDENAQIVDGINSDASINISGRDLSKLFIEDGTYFYALEMSQGQLKFAGGTSAKNTAMQRVYSTNALQYFSLYNYNSIENVLKFVIQQLSTIKIVPDDLFDAYGSRRNTRYTDENTRKLKQNQPQLVELDKIKDKVKNSIVSIRKQCQLTKRSKQQEDREVEKLWKQLLKFFRHIRANQFRTVAGNLTTGWSAFQYESEFIETNTLPSFCYSALQIVQFHTHSAIIKKDEDSLFIALDQYLDVEKTKTAYKDKWGLEYASGIWQIIKLVIDKSVTERRISDSSAATANGSLLNFIRKVCQEPFVEFYMDTYGDMYHLIVRRPPTDEYAIKNYIDGEYEVERDFSQPNESNTVSIKNIIDIEIEDVLQEQLVYDDQNVFSWYQLTPQANFIGNGSSYSLAYLPAIFFEEYADIWGSRPLQITHNYLPRFLVNSGSIDLDKSELQAFHDLKYLIDSHSYLPFTRKGTITTNGDRRYKIGNAVRYKATGEIFFITDVQQNISISETAIDRTSTISVERGMFEKAIRGIAVFDEKDRSQQIEDRRISYFDIIQSDLQNTSTQTTETITEKIQVGTRPIIKDTFKNDTDYSQQSNDRIRSLYKEAQKYEGYRYGLGNKGEGKKIDCSGFVTAILNGVGISTIPDMSENLMTRSNNFHSITTLDVNLLKPGDVIGFDHGPKIDRNGVQWDRGRKYGIDHIAIVVQNDTTGELELAESVGGVGVRFRPLGDAIKKYNNPKIKKFVGDYRSGELAPTITEEEPIYETKTRVIKKNKIERAKVFSNFKVDKDNFNFFVRRKQWDDNLLSYEAAARGEGNDTVGLEDVVVRGKIKKKKKK